MNWEKKTVLVTGSKGFLGSFVVKELEKLCPKKILSYSSEELDLRNNSNCKKAVQNVDVVFHLAALIGIPYSYISPLAYLRTNVEGTYNVLEAAKKLREKEQIAHMKLREGREPRRKESNYIRWIHQHEMTPNWKPLHAQRNTKKDFSYY